MAAAIVIEVCERPMDHGTRVVADKDGKAIQERCPAYQAHIKSAPGTWDRGLSREEAIGNLIRSHPELFGVQIVDLDAELPELPDPPEPLTR